MNLIASPFETSPVVLTPSQSECLNAFRDFLMKEEGPRIFLLRGPAGTGKTFLIQEMRKMMNDLRISTSVVAPTGRAAQVVSHATQSSASTLHSKLYELTRAEEAWEGEAVRLTFPLRSEPPGNREVLIVDEASMVGDVIQESELLRFGSGNLLDDTLRYYGVGREENHTKLVFVGDPYQLPPIGTPNSAALDAKWFLRKHNLEVVEVELTDLVRHSGDSGILKHATGLRTALQHSRFAQLDLPDLPPEVVEGTMGQWLSFLKPGCPGPIPFITFTNARVSTYNQTARRHLYGSEEALPQYGEPLMAVRNSRVQDMKVFNGDFLKVLTVSDDVERRTIHLKKKNEHGDVEVTPVELSFRMVTLETQDPENAVEFGCLINDGLLWSDHPSLTEEETRALYVDFFIRTNEQRKSHTLKELVMGDPYLNALQLKFGYSLTCHKAQGGEWPEVMVDCGDRKRLNEDCFRWLYTAVTRAKERLYLVEPPRIRALDSSRVDAAGGRVREQASLEEQVQSCVAAGGMEVQGMIAQPYAMVVNVKRGEEEQQVRICYNGKDVVTSISLKGTPSGSFDQELLAVLSPLKGKCLQMQEGAREQSPPVPGTMEVEGELSEFQQAALEQLHVHLQEKGLWIPWVKVFGAFQLKVLILDAMGGKTRWDLYTKKTGCISRFQADGGFSHTEGIRAAVASCFEGDVP